MATVSENALPTNAWLTDRAALQDLVQAYAHLVDARAFDQVAALFTQDAELVAPAPPDHLSPHRTLAGRQAIRDELAQLSGFETTVHAVQGHVLTSVSPTEALGHVRCEAHHVSTRPGEGGVRDLVWLVRYEDTYRRDEQGWRFARRAITIDSIDVRTVKRVNPRPA